MQIQKSQFPSIIPDNEQAYLKYLEAIINSIDPFSSVEVTYKPTGYLVRIAPSVPEYLIPLLQEIKVFHSHLEIQVEFSKSIKTATTLTFVINNDK